MDSLMTIRVRAISSQALASLKAIESRIGKIGDVAKVSSAATVKANGSMIRSYGRLEAAAAKAVAAQRQRATVNAASASAVIAQNQQLISSYNAVAAAARAANSAGAMGVRRATAPPVPAAATRAASGAASAAGAGAAAASAGAAGAQALTRTNGAATALARGGLAQATAGAKALHGNMLNAFGSKMASQIQWIGRQITYNFSMPLAAAGVIGVAGALKVEAAMTRLTKVYGDQSNAEAFNQTLANGMTLAQSETQALGRYFVELSNRFGVAQEAVANIGADWAQAGSSGAALAESVKLTLETMVLGEIDAETATKALISTQAQWGIAVGDTKGGVLDLKKAIDIMNMAENESSASMPDLLEAFTRVAGSARTAGATVEELSALIASLVPAAGSAANAGNALKTIFSRILSPTKEAAEIMGLMGFNTQDAGWQSLTATQRLNKMSEAWKSLTQTQKAQVSASIASRWQISRFDILMEDLGNSMGRYNKTLAATSDTQANAAQRQKELNAVLESNPERLKQAWQQIRNSLIAAVIPLIPSIVALVQGIADVTKRFGELAPATQKFILYAAAALIVLGPMVRILGALGNLVLVLLSPIKLLALGFWKLGGVALGLGRLLLAPFLLLGGAITGAVGLVSRAAMGIGSAFVAAAKIVPAVLSGLSLAIGRFALLWVAFWVRVPPIVMGAMSAASAAFMAAIRVIIYSFQSLTVAMAAITMYTARAVALMGTIWGALPGIVAAVWASIGGIVAAGLGAIVSVPGLIIAGIIALVVIFKDQIVQVFSNLLDNFRGAAGGIAEIGAGIANIWNKIVEVAVKAFNKLPSSIRGALQAVVDTVRNAVMAVYKLFSYLNPFAHHSPSLVETVTWGMAEVRKQYASVGNVGATFKKAASDLAAFKTAAAGLKGSDFSTDRENVAKARPSALGSFDALEGSYNDLNEMADRFNSLIGDQQNVVDAAKNKLDAANDVLNTQKDILTDLQDKLDSLQKRYDSATDAVNKFASSPLVGMRQMSDAIFENEQAAKQLQLDMMDWENVNGSIDDVRSSYENLGQAIADLISMQSSLRSKGAGSEILGPLQEQIDSLRGAQSAGSGTDAYDAMEKKLKDVNREGQRLQLLNSLKFDPLTRQIDQLANGMDELPFDAVIDGIKAQKRVQQDLTPQIEAATQAVNNQEEAVRAAEAASKAVQAAYDNENGKLDALKKQYDEVRNAIQAVSGELNSMGQAAAEANAALEKASKAAGAGGGGGAGKDWSPGAENFMSGGAGDFETVGGTDTIGREGGFGDQTAQIDAMIADMQNEAGKAFASVDMFAPFKEQWNKLVAWWNENLAGPIGQVVTGIKDTFKGLFSGNIFEGVDFLTPLRTAWQKVKDFFALDDIGAIIGNLFEGLGPTIEDIWRNIQDIISGVWDTIGPPLKDLWDSLGPLVESLLPLLAIVLGVVAGAVVFLVGALSGGLKPVVEGIGWVFQGIVTILTGVIQIVTGVAQIIGGVLVGAFNMAMGIAKAAGRVFQGIWEVISGLFTLDFSRVWGGIKNIFGGIGEFFGSIMSGALDIIGSIWKGIGTIFQGVFNVIKGIFQGIVGFILGVFGGIWGAITGGFKALINTIGTFLGGAGQKIFTVISNVIGWLGELPGKMLELGKWLIEGLWDGITGAASWLWGKVGEFFDWLLTMVKDFFGIASPSKVFAEIGGWLVQGLMEGIKALGQGLLDVGIWIIQTVWDGIKSLAQTVWDWFKGVAGWIAGVVGTLVTAMGDIGRSVLTWMWDGIKGLAQTVWDWFKGIAGWIASTVGSVASSVVSIGKDVINWIWDGIKNVAQNVWDWFKGIGIWIAGAVSGLWESITGIGKNIVTWIWNGIKNVWNDVTSWFANLPALIAAAFSWENIKSIGVRIVNGIVEGIKSAAGAIGTAVQSAVDNNKPMGSSGEFFDVSGLIFGNARGGPIVGPGTGTSDSILRRLSNGEFVITAEKYKQNKDLINAVHTGQVDSYLAQAMAAQRAESEMMSNAAASTTVPGGSYASATTNVNINISGGISFPNVTDRDGASEVVSGLLNLSRSI